MFYNIFFLIIGFMIFCGGIFYWIKFKHDKDSIKIYSIVTSIGFLITLIFGIQLIPIGFWSTHYETIISALNSIACISLVLCIITLAKSLKNKTLSIKDLRTWLCVFLLIISALTPFFTKDNLNENKVKDFRYEQCEIAKGYALGKFDQYMNNIGMKDYTLSFVGISSITDNTEHYIIGIEYSTNDITDYYGYDILINLGNYNKYTILNEGREVALKVISSNP